MTHPYAVFRSSPGRARRPRSTLLGAWPTRGFLGAACVFLGAMLLACAPIPGAIALTPRLFVYAQNRRELYGFRFRANGTLMPVPGSPWDIGFDHEDGTPQMDQTVVFSKRRRLLFVSNEGGVSVFRIEESGSLSPWAAFPFGGGGFAGLAVMDMGESTFVYAAERAQSRVRGFRAQGTTLTELPDSPYPAGRGAHSMAQARRAFYCLAHDQTITGYRVGEDGGVTQLPGSPYRVAGFETLVLTLAIEPRGRFVYGIDALDQGVHGFRVLQPSGALQRLAGSPFRVIRGRWSEQVDVGAVFDTRGLGFAFGGAPASLRHIQAIRRLPSGELRAVGKARWLDDRPGAAALDPNGRFLLTGGIEGGDLTSYRIQRGGRELKRVDEKSICEDGPPRPTGIAFVQL